MKGWLRQPMLSFSRIGRRERFEKLAKSAAHGGVLLVHDSQPRKEERDVGRGSPDDAGRDGHRLSAESLQNTHAVHAANSVTS